MSLFKLLIDLIGYAMARASLPLLSFGKIYVAPFTTLPQRLRWPGYSRDDQGRVEVEQAAAGPIGLAISLALLILIAVLIQVART